MGNLTPELAALRDETRDLAKSYGLDFFEVIFELVDHDELNMVASYGGFPVRYPHWRFGMEYEHLSKSYAYGLSKIYELVINNDPCYAYLMRSNSITEQKLVMAHVYGHCDFFKNNAWFTHTSRKMMDVLANHGARIRRYMDRHGQERVENFIDVVHSLDNLIDPYSPYIDRGTETKPRRDDGDARVRAEPGELTGLGERRPEAADGVDEPEPHPLAAAVDLPFREHPDVGRAHGTTARAPAFRDAREEQVVDPGHRLEDTRLRRIVPPHEQRLVSGARGRAGLRARGERLGVDTETLERVAPADLSPDDPDRADDAHRLREDVVARRREVIPAARRHVADAEHERLLLPELHELVPHQVARERAAAGRIDPDDHGLHVVVLLELPHDVIQLFLRDTARAQRSARSHGDAPRRPQQRDRPALRRVSGERAHDLPEVGVAVLRARAEDDALAHRARGLLQVCHRLVGVADAVHEPERLRARGRVRTVLDDVGGGAGPRRGERLEPRGAEIAEHAGERRAGLRRRPITRERLLGPLVFSHLQHVDRQVQLVGEQPA